MLYPRLAGALAVSTLLGLSACNSTEAPGSVAQSQVLGTDDFNHEPLPAPTDHNGAPIPAPAPTTPAETMAPAIGPTCHSADPARICLALKLVAYENANGAPVLTAEQAVANLAGVNALLDQCGIAFQIDEFDSTDPTGKGLLYAPKDLSELTAVRRSYLDDRTLLVVTTGAWNRSGTLGDTGANAWTAGPGNTYPGVVIEQPSGTYAPIIAHELGHYLNLPHLNDNQNVMNPVIYRTSDQLTAAQCSSARAAATRYWQAMAR